MKFNRLASLALSLFLALSLSGVAAAQGVVSPQYTHTRRVSASLTISGGVASCVCSSKPKPSSETRCVHLSVSLQRKQNGVWFTLKTWSATATNATASVMNDYTVTKGYDYRLRAVSEISDAEGVLLEKATKYSSVVSCPAT